MECDQGAAGCNAVYGCWRLAIDRAAKHSFEGIVAKRLDSVYTPGVRTGHWLKIKAKAALQAMIDRKELFERI